MSQGRSPVPFLQRAERRKNPRHFEKCQKCLEIFTFLDLTHTGDRTRGSYAGMFWSFLMCTHPANMGHIPLGLLAPHQKLDFWTWLEIAKFHLFSYRVHPPEREAKLIAIVNSERSDRSIMINCYLPLKVPLPWEPFTHKTQVYGFWPIWRINWDFQWIPWSNPSLLPGWRSWLKVAV